MLASGKVLFALASSRSERFELSTTAPTGKARRRRLAESKLTIELIARMDKALPEWEQYVADQGEGAAQGTTRPEGVRRVRALYTALRRSRSGGAAVQRAASGPAGDGPGSGGWPVEPAGLRSDRSSASPRARETCPS